MVKPFCTKQKAIRIITQHHEFTKMNVIENMSDMEKEKRNKQERASEEERMRKINLRKQKEGKRRKAEK